ncbi:MAG: cold shock domain-containing protein [Phascolarctobacterium sp.]|nr:cold shock domain-containing protein [Phascolarctobacterium sp.]
MIGEVKWFNVRKGWGFIETPDGDALVHYKDILTPCSTGFRTLNPHDLVGFDEVRDVQGLKAKNVFKI